MASGKRQFANGGKHVSNAGADLPVDEFKSVIREVVFQTIHEILSDPDEGLELREDMVAYLTQSLAAMQAGEKTSSIQDVATRLDLDY
ncbi:MAG: hypothetical protein JW934_14775 [Anaerolineae bacterium]|nr:hypothetical protein [Anaerolineae bacterium]